MSPRKRAEDLVVIRKPKVKQESAPKHKAIKIVSGKKDPAKSRYQLLLDSIYDAVVLTDLDGAILEVNPRAVEIFGYAAKDFAGLHIGGIVNKLDEHLISAIRDSVGVDKHTILDGICTCQDGSTFSAEVAVGYQQVTPDHGLLFMVRNVSDRKRTEQMLETINNALHNAAVGIAITSPDGIIEVANPAFLDLWKIQDVSAVIGRDIKHFIEHPKKIALIINKITLTAQSTQAKITGIRPDGFTFPLDMSAAPNLDKGSYVTGIVFSCRDLTATDKAEQMTREASEKGLEAERAKARLDAISALGYAVNSPLQALLCMTEADGRADYRQHIESIISILSELQNPGQPATTEPSETVETYTPSSGSHLEPCTQSILVIDDEELVSSFFVKFLQSALPKTRLESASSGRAGLDSFAQHHHKVILLDYMMPDMNGEETFAELQKICAENNWQSPHVIFCTGFIPPDTVNPLIQEGTGNALIRKPVGRDDLLQVVNGFMDT